MNNIDYFIELQQHPLIREFAEVKPDTLELIKATNPTLLMFVELAKKICSEKEAVI
ncbi:hypothetical protein [Methanomethylovorans sp.]|uniref:hypothetical protein n=1 Tax=Methanomethylovorans sp. TaxID=2758717 RepID=UPI00345F0674